VLPNSFNQSRLPPWPRPVACWSVQPEAGATLDFSISAPSQQGCYKHIDALITALPEFDASSGPIRAADWCDGDDRRAAPARQQLRLSEAVLLPVRIAERRAGRSLTGSLQPFFALPERGEGSAIVFLRGARCGKPVLAGQPRWLQ